MKLWSRVVLLGACVAGVLGCDDKQTYVKVDVVSRTALMDVTLSLTIAGQDTKTFRNVNLGPTTAYKAGLSVPASLTGTIVISGEASSGTCVVGTGGPVSADAHAAETGDGVMLTITPVTGCPGADAGTDARDGGG